MKPKQQRRNEAASRDAAWRGLSPSQRLAALDARLGKGVGAVKQRARLAAMLEAGRPGRTKEEKAMELGILYGAGKNVVASI